MTPEVELRPYLQRLRVLPDGFCQEEETFFTAPQNIPTAEFSHLY